jgi:hypothetical protein
MATLDDLFTTYLSAEPPSVQPYPAAVARAVKAHTERAAVPAAPDAGGHWTRGPRRPHAQGSPLHPR